MQRVVEVWVPDVAAPGGPAVGAGVPGTVGTGYLVAARAVLTARHVIRAALRDGLGAAHQPPAQPRLKVRPLGERGAAPGAWLPATVAWEDEDLDAALIEILGAGASHVGATVFAEVAGDVHVTAVGFPIVERQPDRVRDTDQATGDVLYGAGWKRNRLVFDVRSSVARMPAGAGARSGWEGISGAGLLAGHRLVGVVVADHAPEQHQGRRLEVIPITAILRAAGFSNVAASLGAVLRLERAGAESRGRLEPASLPLGVVDRPRLRKMIADALAVDEAPIVALVGPPGFGKTTLALQSCHHPLVARRCPGGALWLALGDEPDLAASLARTYADLTGSAAAAVTDEDLAQRIGDELSDRSALLVIDDVWHQAALDAILGRTGRVPRLVTTRNLALVEDWARTIILVDEPLLPDEAVAVLAPAPDASDRERAALARLAERVGRWPLLLALAGGQLRRLDRRGLSRVDAVERLEQQYAELGAVAFDARRPEQRRQAVMLTMAASLDQLPEADRRRYATIAIFPPADGVPLHILADLWGLAIPAAESLLLDLADRSLLRYDPKARTALLHQVIRDFLYRQLPDPAGLHRDLVARWGDPLALTDRYRTTYIAWHMAQAGQNDRLFALIDDMDWYAAQLSRDPSGSAYLSDLGQAWAGASGADTAAVEKTGQAPLLAREICCALVTASLHSRSGTVRSKLLVALIKAGLWTPSEALAAVKQNPYSKARGYALTVLAPYLSGPLLSDAVDTARGLEDPADVLSTLAALVSLVPLSGQAALANEALDLARRTDDNTALASAAKILPEHAMDEVLREAWDRTVAIEDPKDRFDKLLPLGQMVPDVDPGLVRDTMLEAAHGIEDPADRARALIELMEGADLLSGTQRPAAAAGAWNAMEQIEELNERQEVLVELADLAPEDRLSEAIRALLDASRTVEELHYDMADVLAAAVRCAVRMRGPAAGVLAEARTRAATQADPANRATALAALAGAVADPDQRSLMAEAFEIIHAIPIAEQAGALLRLGNYVPEAFRNDVLQGLPAAARAVEPRARRASALRAVAVLLPEADQDALLREAHEITPLLQSGMEPDGAEFVRAAIALTPRISAAWQAVLVAEMLNAARQIADPHDRSRALAESLPFLPAREQRKVAAEALDAASRSASDIDQADALATVVPYLKGRERDQISARAVEHTRAIDDTAVMIASSATLTEREEGIWEADADWVVVSNVRARLLAQLSAVRPARQRKTLVREAVDAVYASFTQADTLIEVSPHLPATAVRELLTSIRTAEQDPIRTQVLAKLLARLADLESPQSAREQAAAIYGHSIPATVLAALARPPADTAADGHNGPQDGATENPLSELPTGAGDDESEPSPTITLQDVQVEAYPGFPHQLFRLIPPQEPIMQALFSLPPSLEASRSDIERQLLEDAVAWICSELPPDEVRPVLGDAAEFMQSPGWTRAKAALVSRLVDLGLAESAMGEVEATWPESPPARVFTAISGPIEPDRQRRLAASILAATWEIEDPKAKADALAALLPHIPAVHRERAQDYIAGVIRDRLAASPSPGIATELTELLRVLPSSRRLPLWQDALHAAARGTRRQLLTQMPALIACAETFGTRELHEQVTESLVDVRRRWS
jgi:NB-ARC domain